MSNYKSYHLKTLGCSKNEVDSQRLKRYLMLWGMKETSEVEAELIILNTCGFIQAAVEESLDEILRLSERKKDHCRKLVVMGCLPQRYQRELVQELPEVDLFLGTGYLEELLELLEGEERLVTDRLRSSQKGLILPLWQKSSHAYLKIAEGCDNCCSYCLIPSLRGPYRSREISDVLQEARELQKKGVKELILIAQDVSRFGMDRGERELIRLLQEMEPLDEIQWIRLQYLYPDVLDEAFFVALKDCKKVLPYFDIPIQHASDPVLRRMNRHTSKKDLMRVIESIRRNFPEATLRTTVMVGFPGETEDDFQELMEFLREMRFERLGAFEYSDEEGSPSSHLPHKVSSDTAKRRYEILMQQQADISEEIQREKVGRSIQVILDEKNQGGYLGRSRADAPEVDGVIFVKTEKKYEIGEFVQVNITGADVYDLEGEIDESAN